MNKIMAVYKKINTYIKNFFVLITFFVIFSSVSFAKPECPVLYSKLLYAGNKNGNDQIDVVTLQTFLKQYFNLTDKQFLVTGKYGLVTKKYVREYQTVNNLIPTGVVGLTTINSFQKFCKQQTEPQSQSEFPSKTQAPIVNIPITYESVSTPITVTVPTQNASTGLNQPLGDVLQNDPMIILPEQPQVTSYISNPDVSPQVNASSQTDQLDQDLYENSFAKPSQTNTTTPGKNTKTGIDVEYWYNLYKADLEAVYSPQRENWASVVAWNTSYKLDAILDLYDKSKDSRLIELAIKYADTAFSKRENVLKQTSSSCVYGKLDSNSPVWVVKINAGSNGYKKNCFATDAGLNGRILGAIARLVRTLDTNKMFFSQFQSKGANYETMIQNSLDFHESTDGGIRFYTYSKDGKNYAYSMQCPGCKTEDIEEKRINLQSPLNLIAAAGRPYVELSYKSPYYEKRALAFARTVKDLIERSKQGTTWLYWPAYGNQRLEDISHGYIVVEFMIIFEKLIGQSRLNNDIQLNTEVKAVFDNFDKIIRKTPQIELSNYMDGSMGGVDARYKNMCGLWMSAESKASDLFLLNSKKNPLVLYPICTSICSLKSDKTKCTKITDSLYLNSLYLNINNI